MVAIDKRLPIDLAIFQLCCNPRCRWGFQPNGIDDIEIEADRRGGTQYTIQGRDRLGAVVDATVATGEVGMSEPFAEALAAFRAFNYELIYMRPASVAQGEVVARVKYRGHVNRALSGLVLDRGGGNVSAH